MASTRRAVIAGGGAIAAAVATSAAALASTERFDASVLRKIDAVGTAHRKARLKFKKAVAAFKASIPEPHWSINFNDRDRALCGSWSSKQQSRFADIAPAMCPTLETLDRDLASCAQHFPERYGRYRRLTRRLKARVKRRQAFIERAERRFRLDDLERDCDAAERQLIEFANAIFEAPASTTDAVRAQAYMLVVFSKQINSRSWAYCQPMGYGPRLAENILALGRSQTLALPGGADA